MKNKIIYVDFIKKRKTTLPHFIIYRIIYFLSNKFNFKTQNYKQIDNIKNKRLFSKLQLFNTCSNK